eukprot:1348776-Amorphochlora_amoeboformis.AAC.1
MSSGELNFKAFSQPPPPPSPAPAWPELEDVANKRAPKFPRVDAPRTRWSDPRQRRRPDRSIAISGQSKPSVTLPLVTITTS